MMKRKTRMTGLLAWVLTLALAIPGTATAFATELPQSEPQPAAEEESIISTDSESDPMLSVPGVYADEKNKAAYAAGEAELPHADEFGWYRYEFDIPADLDRVGVSEDGVGELYFRLFVPETEEGRTYPLVANLGGLGSTNTMTTNGYAQRGMHFASDVFQAENPCYVLTFNVPYEACVNYEAELDYVYQMGEVMKAVNEAYGNVDMDRLYATGMSQGAGWSYELAYMQPDLPAAILINAGTTVHTTWGDQVDMNVLAESDVNIAILHGYNDPYIPVNEAYRVYNTLTRLGKKNIIMDISDDGHCVNSATSATEITPYMEWLFSQRKGVPCTEEPQLKEAGNRADYKWAGYLVYPQVEGWTTAHDYANWVEPAESEVWDQVKAQSNPITGGIGGTGQTYLAKVRIGDETSTSYDTTRTIKAGDTAAVTIQGYTGLFGDYWEAFNDQWTVDWAVLEGTCSNIELTCEASAEPILRPETVTLANGGGPNVNNSLYNENTLDGQQVYVKIDTAEEFEGDTLKVALRFTRKLSGGEYASYIHVVEFEVEKEIPLLNDLPMKQPETNRSNQQPYKGLYRQELTVGEDTREMLIYLSRESRINEYFVTVALPDGADPVAFLENSGWLDICDRTKCCLRVLIPANGTWGTYAEESAYISKAMAGSGNAFTGSHYTAASFQCLYGIGEGGKVLEEYAAQTPMSIISQVYIDTDLTGDVLEEAMKDVVYGDDMSTASRYETSTLSSAYTDVAAMDVPVPTWLMNSDAGADYWKTVNDCKAEAEDGIFWQDKAKSNAIATSYSDVVSQVRVSESADYMDPAVSDEVYEFLSTYTRSVGDSVHANVLGWRVDYEEAREAGKLFEVFDYVQTVDNSENPNATTAATEWLRNYLVYVPDACMDYRTKQYPVVYFFSGGSTPSHIYFDETHAAELAEKYGFIVVVPSSVNGWNTQDGSWPETIDKVTGSISDDIDYMDELFTVIEKDFNVDPGRVYITGLSMGGIFCNYLGMQLGDRITAIGLTSGPIFGSETYNTEFSVGGGMKYMEGATENVLPTMCIFGEKDNWPIMIGPWSPETVDTWYPGQMHLGNRYNDAYYSYATQKYWIERNGLDFENYQMIEKGLTAEGQVLDSVVYNAETAAERYTTYVWKDEQGIPLFSWVQCAGRAHSTAVSDYEKVWTDWFADFTMDGEGKRYYKGQKVGEEAAPEKVQQTVTIGAESPLTLTVGTKNYALNAATDGDGTLTYTTSDEKVATVDARGRITVTGTGQAVITVTASETDTCREASAEITVIGQAKPRPADPITVIVPVLKAVEKQVKTVVKTVVKAILSWFR